MAENSSKVVTLTDKMSDLSLPSSNTQCPTDNNLSSSSVSKPDDDSEEEYFSLNEEDDDDHLVNNDEKLDSVRHSAQNSFDKDESPDSLESESKSQTDSETFNNRDRQGQNSNTNELLDSSESKSNSDMTSKILSKPHLQDDNCETKDECEDDEEEDDDNDDDDNVEDDDDNVEEINEEEYRKSLEETLSDDQKLERKAQSQELKDGGNKLFREENYTEAIDKYTEALKICPFSFPKDRSILYSNRGASHMKLESYDAAIKDCTHAVDLHPHYLKALLRRAELYEKTEKLDEALADYQKAVELDPSQSKARITAMRLQDEIKVRNEKMKDEMLGKLKDLGNLVLKPFGLSTDSFQMQQNPDTGSYSVNFKQN